MVPVKIQLSRPYYKQKTGRVMKKIYIFAILFFGTAAYGATTPLGAAIARNSDAPRYLINAADAWNSVIGEPLRAGTIATRMSDINTPADSGRLYDVMSVLAFNHTAMTLYQTQRHLDATYDFTARPLMIRRVGRENNFVLNAHGVASTDKYEHHKNDDFEMRTGGAGASAYAYVTDGLAFGVGYTYAKSKSHDMPLDADGTSNIISLFGKYLSENGWNMNMTLAAGQTQWDLDKTVIGVRDKTAFNTDIYSAQISTGMTLNRGIISINPEISTRYTRMVSEKHVDAAAQDFKKWWYNTLSIDAGLRVGINFAMTGIIIQPMANIGGGYDIIHNGTDNIRTRLITGESYEMPVHAPSRAELRTGAGIGIYGPMVSVIANYTLHSRSDYMAHEIKATAKIAF